MLATKTITQHCVIVLAVFMLMLSISCKKDNDDSTIVRDREGNEYHTVTVGDQVWMTENLRTALYSNGDTIKTTVPVNLNISDESEPKYQWVYGGDNSNLVPYGRLYTYYAVSDPRNVCPSGWHVPDYSEYMLLEDTLGGSFVAGGKLKESGFEHWIDPNTGATNESEFAALPGGYRSHSGGNTIGGSQTLGRFGYYWTSTSIDDSYAESRRFQYDVSSVGSHTTEKSDGISVRCIKD
jgi:uncharacterized protein (TIGR02145 family)